jgi:hypothetical protein
MIAMLNQTNAELRSRCSTRPTPSSYAHLAAHSPPDAPPRDAATHAPTHNHHTSHLATPSEQPPTRHAHEARLPADLQRRLQHSLTFHSPAHTTPPAFTCSPQPTHPSSLTPTFTSATPPPAVCAHVPTAFPPECAPPIAAAAPVPASPAGADGAVHAASNDPMVLAFSQGSSLSSISLEPRSFRTSGAH